MVFQFTRQALAMQFHLDTVNGYGKLYNNKILRKGARLMSNKSASVLVRYTSYGRASV